MNKDVIITIKGLQKDDQQNATITSTLKGSYYEKNNKHYVMYEEQLIENDPNSLTNNTLIFSLSDYVTVDLIKRGYQNSKMCFRAGEQYASPYKTIYGILYMETKTLSVDLKILPDSIHADIEYDLFLNDDFVSHNQIIISVANQ